MTVTYVIQNDQTCDNLGGSDIWIVLQLRASKSDCSVKAQNPDELLTAISEVCAPFTVRCPVLTMYSAKPRSFVYTLKNVLSYTKGTSSTIPFA